MKASKGIYLQIAPCLFAIIIDALGFGLVYPVMTALFISANTPMLPLDASSSVRHFYLGLGFMLYPLCMFFGTSFMGDLSDSYGRKKVLTLCMGGIFISFLLMALGVTYSSIFLLMLGRALSGLVAGSQPIAQAAVSDLSTQDNLAKNMSILSFSYCIGTILGPLVGGVTSDSQVVSWFNFATPFYIAATFALIAVIWLMVSFKETFISLQKKKLTVIRPIQLFIEAFKHRGLRQLAIVFLFMQLGFSIFFQFIVVLMKSNHDYSNFQLGLLQGMIGLGFAIGLLFGMPLCLKHFRLTGITLIAGVLTGLFQIASALIHIDWMQWPLAVFTATSDIIAFTGMLTLFSNAVSDNKRGFAMGIANAAMALSWAFTGLFSNLINFIGIRGLLFSGGIFLIIGSLFLLRYRKSNGD